MEQPTSPIQSKTRSPACRLRLAFCCTSLVKKQRQQGVCKITSHVWNDLKGILTSPVGTDGDLRYVAAKTRNADPLSLRAGTLQRHLYGQTARVSMFHAYRKDAPGSCRYSKPENLYSLDFPFLQESRIRLDGLCVRDSTLFPWETSVVGGLLGVRTSILPERYGLPPICIAPMTCVSQHRVRSLMPGAA